MSFLCTGPMLMPAYYKNTVKGALTWHDYHINTISMVRVEGRCVSAEAQQN